MEYHKDYLNNTYRKLLRVVNPDVQYEYDTSGDTISFREWLREGKLHGTKMIEGVETMKDDLVRVIYNKNNQKGVDFIIQNL